MKEKQLSLFDDPSFFESVDVEFKSARGGVPRSLWETYSAFANTSGGTIYLGIAEAKDHSLDVHGIENPGLTIDTLWATLNNKGKVSHNLLTHPDISLIDVGAVGPCVIMRVPRANRSQRPVYLNNDPFGSTYRRSHSGDYRCDEYEVRRMFADQSMDPADSRILVGFTLADVHQDSLLQFRRRMIATNPSHPWISEDDSSLLRKLGGWRRDRQSDSEGLTVAGLLMFGLQEAIQSAEAVPQFHIDYRERLSDDPEQRWTDRLTTDGSFEGNLFQFYTRALPKISGTLKNPFNLDRTLYRFDESSVAAGIREALVNALIHADYQGQGGIVIDRWPDRIEFSNPGTLLLSHEQLLKGGVSECRNRSLQTMFQLMGAGDKAGSGLDKIRSSWAGAKLRDPRLSETQRPDRVILDLPMVSLLSENCLQQLRETFGDRFDSLAPEDIQILAIAQDEGAVTNLRLQEVLTIHRTDVTKVLQQLVRHGFLMPQGFGRWTKYVLPNPLGWANVKAVTSTDTSTDSSTGTNADSTIAQLTSDTRPLQERNPSSWLKLMDSAEHVRARTRMSPRELQHATLRLFESADWLTRNELALLLGRNSENIRDAVLNPLLHEGALRLRYDSKNHPAQAYALARKQN